MGVAKKGKHSQWRSDRQAVNTLIKANKRTRRMTNAVWALGYKHAPMFMRVSKAVDPQTNKKRHVANRLVRTNAWKLMCSGAALRSRGLVQKVATKLRMGSLSTESSRYPWLPSMSNGATLLLEQACCAWAQTGVHHAATMRKMSGGKLRINAEMMTHGFGAATEQIFANGNLVPRLCVVSSKHEAMKGTSTKTKSGGGARQRCRALGNGGAGDEDVEKTANDNGARIASAKKMKKTTTTTTEAHREGDGDVEDNDPDKEEAESDGNDDHEADRLSVQDEDDKQAGEPMDSEEA